MRRVRASVRQCPQQPGRLSESLGFRWLVLIASMFTLSAAASAEAPSTLSDEEMAQAEFIYFDRCSGCHGALRKGATGPNIAHEAMLKKSLIELEMTIYEGTDAGMPGWGRTGELTTEESALMAKFVQIPAPTPPEMGLKAMKATHKLHVPVADRPSKPQHKRNIDNYFGSSCAMWARARSSTATPRNSSTSSKPDTPSTSSAPLQLAATSTRSGAMAR